MRLWGGFSALGHGGCDRQYTTVGTLLHQQLAHRSVMERRAMSSKAATSVATERLEMDDFRRRLVAGSFRNERSNNLCEAMKDLQFVQADPIRAPARAQDLVLRQRVMSYKAGQLEEAFPQLSLEEGFLFAYGFMTPEAWRNLHMPALQQEPSILTVAEREILTAVGEMGQVHPKDLDDRFGDMSVANCWGGKSKMTKKILDDLHHRGILRVSRRDSGVRVYQVPSPITSVKQTILISPLQRFCNMVMTTAHVFGPTTRRFLMSELKIQGGRILPKRNERVAAITGLLAAGQLQQVEVEGVNYIWIRNEWQKRSVPERVRILAPFDPLVRDRARFEQTWGWAYRLEAYVPAAKRERGYYAMPLLWHTDVIGWANAKVKDACLNVEFGYAAGKKRPRSKAFRILAEAEVEAMAVFLGLDSDTWELKL